MSTSRSRPLARCRESNGRAAARTGVGGPRLPAAGASARARPRTPTTSASAAFICERWLGSTTTADNRVGSRRRGTELRRRRRRRPAAARATRSRPTRSRSWAPTTRRLTPPASGRLAKLFDYAARLPYHIHPPQEYASLVGAQRPRTSPTTSLPASTWVRIPESFFGVHPWIGRAAGARRPAAVPRRLGQRPHPQARPGRAAGGRRGLPHPVRRAARARDRPHARAAGGLRRPRDVPGAERRQDHLQGPAVQGRTPPGPRGARRAVPVGLRGLGAQRRPVLLREPPPEPSAGRRGPRSRVARSGGSSTTRRSTAARSSW